MADIDIQEQSAWGIATLMARKGVAARQVGALLEMEIPERSGVAVSGPVSVVCTAPGTWLALSSAGSEGWTDGLARRMEGVASVSEQSAGYSLLAVSGADASPLLQAGTFLDLRDDAFPPGRAAATVISYIGVTIWRPSPEQRFFVALYRSYRASFDTWIKHAAATL